MLGIILLITLIVVAWYATFPLARKLLTLALGAILTAAALISVALYLAVSL